MVSVVFNGKTIPATKVPMGVSGSVEYVLTFTKNLDINDFNTALVTCNGVSLSAFDFSVEGKDLHIQPCLFSRKSRLTFTQEKTSE